MVHPMKSFQEDYLNIKIFKNRWEIGYSAGLRAANTIKNKLDLQGNARIVLAATSQKEFLDTLAKAEDVDWSKVTAFHIGEYVGLPEDDPQLVSYYLREQFFALVKPGKVYSLDGNKDPEEECKRYADLLQEKPIDMVCMGIGENGHIAFNDPPAADFMDEATIKPVELDHVLRQQGKRRDNGRLSIAPTQALTLTIPALMSGLEILCMVPGTAKRNAVKRTINGPISTECPASILRFHPNCTLYLDTDSYGQMETEG